MDYADKGLGAGAQLRQSVPFFLLGGPNTLLLLLSKFCHALLTVIFGVIQSKSSGIRANISDRLKPERNITAQTANSIVL
jgi:hypothetical protein